MQNKRGFRPTKRTRDLLHKAHAVYVFKDGVAVLAEETAKTKSGATTRLETMHIFRCPIHIHGSIYDGVDWYPNGFDTSEMAIGFHHPERLVDGITTLQVAFNNTSTKLRRANMCMDTLTLITPNGARHSEDMLRTGTGIMISPSWFVWCNGYDPENWYPIAPRITALDDFIAQCKSHGDAVVEHNKM